jgi:formylglycine-generating enzyme required for sulfatase activity
MKVYYTLLLSLFLLGWSHGQPQGDDLKFYDISPQTISVPELLNSERPLKPVEVDGFWISDQITYGQYKVFLMDQKSRLTAAAYQKLLPDSSICTAPCYQRYLNSNEFDEDAVIGISWEGAMEYCRWKTEKENAGDNIKYAYRLPVLTEWLSALHFSREWGVHNGMNRNYSDWLWNSWVSYTIYQADKVEEIDFVYEAKATDDKTMKRKVAMGNSFLSQSKVLQDHLNRSYYSFKGYKHIGFRIIKLDKKKNKKTFKKLMKLWDLD